MAPSVGSNEVTKYGLSKNAKEHTVDIIV